MRTTFESDKKLLDEVMRAAGEKTLNRAINKALAEYVKRERRQKLIAALGNRDLNLDLDDWYEIRHQERT